MIKYKIEDKKGNSYNITKHDLKKFCQSRGIRQDVIHKTKPSYKGTYSKKGKEREYKEWYKGYRIISESNDELDFEDDILPNREEIGLTLAEEREENILHKENKLARDKSNNILIIPDLHAPFILEGYLKFCKDIYDKYKCEYVVFLGDIIDNHFTSFHDIDPDGYGAGKELKLAKKQIKEFYETFPNACVCEGNHDKIANRKLFKSGVSKRWIKTIGEVLNTPKWEYADSWIINKVKYSHGIGGQATKKRDDQHMSQVQGHYHGQTYLDFKVNPLGIKTFAMQLGVGCDQKQYAFNYAKDFGVFQVNVGVLLDKGRLPIIEHMDQTNQ